MKTLKHNSRGTIAVVTEKTTYLAMLDGTIIKQFPTATFNAVNYTEEVEFPINFEDAKSDFVVREQNKRAERARQTEIYRQQKQEERKNAILNLWNWRKGRIEAFLVCTYVQLNEEGSHNPSGYTRELVFGEEEAYTRFDELKGSETPEWDMKSHNCYFVTELCSTYREISEKERLETTSLEELESLIVNLMDTLSIDQYAPSIEDKDLIITFGRDRWGKMSTSVVSYVEQRRDWSGYLSRHSAYYPAQETTADLGFDQVALTTQEFCDQYPKEAYSRGYMEGMTTDG